MKNLEKIDDKLYQLDSSSQKRIIGGGPSSSHALVDTTNECGETVCDEKLVDFCVPML